MDETRHWQAVLALITGTDRLVSAPKRELAAKSIIEEAEALTLAFEAYWSAKGEAETVAAVQEASARRTTKLGRKSSSGGNIE